MKCAVYWQWYAAWLIYAEDAPPAPIDQKSAEAIASHGRSRSRALGAGNTNAGGVTTPCSKILHALFVYKSIVILHFVCYIAHFAICLVPQNCMLYGCAKTGVMAVYNINYCNNT